jgi:hypothetical protein
MEKGPRRKNGALQYSCRKIWKGIRWRKKKGEHGRWAEHKLE